jgi:hypothetical protein
LSSDRGAIGSELRSGSHDFDRYRRMDITVSHCKRSKMLRAITPAHVENVIGLLERLSSERRMRAAGGQKQSSEEIIHDPLRRKLTDYLYALNDEARGELILLMLAGRGDVEHAFTRALDARSKYINADDQVAYLLGKTVKLAEYLRIGLGAVERGSRTEVSGLPEPRTGRHLDH